MQLPAIPDDGEAVAAQSTGHRLDQHDGRRRRDGRIDRVAALEQHTQAGLRRQRVRGGHDIAGEDGNAGGRVRIDPIEGFHLMISIDSAGTS
ncbi:hypothetical protein [Bordetella pertussis]|uniref:hypothetical protein n=1 Tax=Bordetella pertussis TaxID=520 RepID=UPI0005DD575C|nr:hypothetical protein [Bordetella pertussis]CFP66945.1 Uncharacterised protein [Bordetella pertussis]